MTNKEAIKEIENASYNERKYGDIKNHRDEVMKRLEAFDLAIKALEQQPCEDCISREAVMKCFKKWQPYMATRLWDYEQELKDLPSVTPQPKILEKIREEIVSHIGGNGAVNDGIDIALEVIDKYMEEEE